jgi:hypothetical protein
VWCSMTIWYWWRNSRVIIMIVRVGNSEREQNKIDLFDYLLALFFSVDCVWQWQDWESCSSVCGQGTRTRRRHITRYASNGGDDCHNMQDVDSESCFVHGCPGLFRFLIAKKMKPLVTEDCQWHYGDWEHCSVTCGNGTRTRFLVVDKAPSNGGNSCPTSHSDTESCSQQQCPGLWACFF